MARFDRQIASAKRLIAKNGEKAVMLLPTVGTGGTPYAPIAGEPDPRSVTICFLPMEKDNRESLKLRFADVPFGEYYGLMGQVDFEPVIDAVVIRSNGDKLKVRAVDDMNPNGQQILYWLYFDK